MIILNVGSLYLSIAITTVYLPLAMLLCWLWLSNIACWLNDQGTRVRYQTLWGYCALSNPCCLWCNWNFQLAVNKSITIDFVFNKLTITSNYTSPKCIDLFTEGLVCWCCLWKTTHFRHPAICIHTLTFVFLLSFTCQGNRRETFCFVLNVFGKK